MTDAGPSPYVPPPDLVGPVVDQPGPDCWHPLRLCMVSDPALCPHALTPVMRREGYHPTRCMRGARELTHEEIAAAIGMTKQRVGQIEQVALAKLRRKPEARRVAREMGE